MKEKQTDFCTERPMGIRCESCGAFDCRGHDCLNCGDVPDTYCRYCHCSACCDRICFCKDDDEEEEV